MNTKLYSEAELAREVGRSIPFAAAARKNGLIVPLGVAGGSFVYDESAVTFLKNYTGAVMTRAAFGTSVKAREIHQAFATKLAPKSAA